MIKVKNNLVEGNFTIFVFFGDPGGTLAEWGTAAATVGSFSTFKAPLDKCENCQDAEGEYLYGSVYLTDKLHELLPHHSRLEDRDALSNWLIPKLDWRIRKVSIRTQFAQRMIRELTWVIQLDGTEFTLADGDTTSLHVSVESFMEAYVPYDDNGNPVDTDYGKILGRTFDHARHPDITRGKASKGGDIIVV